MSDLPVPSSRPGIDRAALERVLARAAELHAGTGEGTDLLSDEQILELGREVGISPESVRQALAEERSRIVIPAEDSTVARMFGPALVSATRVVEGTPADVLSALDVWMQREECLQVKRRFPERMVWEARRDLVGNIKRGFNIGGRGYALSRAQDVAATVAGVAPARTLVRLDADLSNVRATRLRGGTATAGIGAAGAGIMFVLGVMAPVAAVPMAIGAGAGYIVARSHRSLVTRAQLAVEQVLDRLEHGEIRRPGNILDVIASVRR